MSYDDTLYYLQIILSLALIILAGIAIHTWITLRHGP